MNKLSKIIFHYRTGSFIFFTAIAILLYVFQPNWFQRFSLGLEDIKFDIRTSLDMGPKPLDNIVIVEVDEASVNKLGRWPWKRSVLADLFTKMSQASAVALDIVFSEKSDAEEDEKLIEAIEENGNIINGFFFRDKASEEKTGDIKDRLADCAYAGVRVKGKFVNILEYTYAETNIEDIAMATPFCAFFNNVPGADGLYRKYLLTLRFDNEYYPPLAIQAIGLSENASPEIEIDEKGIRSFKLKDVNIKDSNVIRLNYYDKVKYIPAYKILNGEIKEDYFKNKIVIVGITEVGIYDMRPTPINPVTPGVSLHYVAINNILKNEFLKTSKPLDYFMVLFAIVLVMAISFGKKQKKRLVYYGFVMVGIYAVSNFVFIKMNMWQHEFFAFLPSFLLATTLETFAFFKTELKAIEMKKAFSSYVSPDLVNEILNDPDRLMLGGEERDISIMFSDIRGFTSLSESLTPSNLVSMLNQIHDPMTKVILKNRGMLDKYIGDAMMCLFNTPVDLEDHHDAAVISALELIRTLHKVNEGFRAEGVPEIDVGVGVNSGMAVCGNMGSTVRFEYTAIGDSVNLASRLEGLCKVYKCRIIISEFTKDKLKKEYMMRLLDKVKVKGKHEPVTIYEVHDVNDEKKYIFDKYNDAISLYFDSRFEDALNIFKHLAEEKEDATSTVFVERCEHYMEEPPEQPWDGSFTLKTK